MDIFDEELDSGDMEFYKDLKREEQRMNEYRAGACQCFCCARLGVNSIQLVVEGGRVYLPNWCVRNYQFGGGNIQEVWFCQFCMRVLEDTFRGAITGLREAERRATKDG